MQLDSIENEKKNWASENINEEPVTHVLKLILVIGGFYY